MACNWICILHLSRLCTVQICTWPKFDGIFNGILRLFIFCNNKVIREWIFMTTLWTLCNSLLMAGYVLPWCDPPWATRPLDEQFRYAPLYSSPWYGCIVMYSVMSEQRDRRETWISFEVSDETRNSEINDMASNLPKYTRNRRCCLIFKVQVSEDLRNIEQKKNELF